ncbi:MAG: hypothetical protein ABIJ05_03870 [Patescibacteria group bacterium]
MSEVKKGPVAQEKETIKSGHRAEIISVHHNNINSYVNNWLEANPNIKISEMTLNEAGTQIDVGFLYKKTEPVENKYKVRLIDSHSSQINRQVNNWLEANPNIDIEKMVTGSSGEQVDVLFLYKEKGSEIK